MVSHPERNCAVHLQRDIVQLKRIDLVRLTAASLLLLLLLSSQALSAMDVSVTKYSFVETYTLNLSGTIEKGDFDKIVRIFRQERNFPRVATIESPGGNILEAIKIAKLFRKGRVMVWAVSGTCNSSCFLIVAGSALREVEVDIGLHRPRYDDSYFAGLAAEDAEKEYKKLNRLVRQFLKESYVPEDIVDMMISTSSDKAIYLTPEEFERRIGKISPDYEEWLLAKCGSMSQQEQEDVELAGILFRIERMEHGEGGASVLGRVSDEEQDRAESAANFSDEYRDYLLKLSQGIRECQSAARREAREEAMLELLRN